MDIRYELYNECSSDFKKVFVDYYKEMGIALKEDTMVFKEIQKSIDNNITKILCVKEEDRLVGFVMFEIKVLKDDNEFIVENLLYIQELYVLKEKRNKGIAKGIISEVEKYGYSSNVKKVILTTREITYDFYIKLGYKVSESYVCKNKLKCFVKEL